jgi:enoyl-CoA hydratase
MEFEQILQQLHADPAVRVAIITGVGDEAFVAGADIRMLKDRKPQDAIDASNRINDLLLSMEAMDEVFIAAINGYAFGGGCELAMACDIRLASDKAQMGQTEVRVGIMPGYGGNVRLMRIVGAGQAKEMIFTGKVIKAPEAERIGLVNRVVPHENLMTEAMALARQIASGPASIHIAKKAMFHAAQLPLAEALKKDAQLYGDVYKTKDFLEGVTAFLDKKKPVFGNH